MRSCISFEIRPSSAVRPHSRWQLLQNSRAHPFHSNKQKGENSRKRIHDVSFRSRDLLNSFEQICRGRKEKQIEVLDQEVESFLERVNKSSLTEHLVARDASSLIRLLGRNRAYHAMLKFCRRYCIDASGSYSSSVKGIVSRQDAEKAILYCYTAAISACSKPSRTGNEYRSKSFLLSLLDEMEHRYTENGPRILPNSYTLSAVLVGIDNGYEALEILEEFEQKYEVESTQKHQIVTVQVYNAAIASCGKSAKKPSGGRGRSIEGWQLGLSLYNKMKRYGPAPDEQTYMSILWTCAEYGQVRVALSILDEISRTPTSGSAAKLYKPLLKACSIAGNTNAAESLIQRMKDESLTITTEHMNLFLLTLAKCKMQTRALEVLHEMVNLQGADQPIVPDIFSFNTVLLACANAEDYEAAKDLLDQMKEGMFLVQGDGTESSMVEIRPDVVSYNTVISCSAPEEALGLINEMRLTRRNRFGVVMPNSITYTNAIASCRKAINSRDREIAYDIAFTLFELAQESSSTGEEVDINVFVYGSLIWMADSVGNHVMAVKLLRSMKCIPNSVCYDGAISALSRRGLARDSLHLYYEMQKLGLLATRGTYLKLSLAINNARDPELISPLKQAALLEGVLSQMPERDRSVAIGGPLFELLIKCHGETKMNSSYAAARSAFDQIVGPVDNNILCAMLSVYSSCKTMWKDAVQLLHTSDIVRDSSGPGRIGRRALSQAVVACAKADEWEEALNLLELYGNDVGSVSKPDAKSEVVSIAAINAIIGACGRSKRPDVAVQILNDSNDKFGVAPDELSYRLAIIACNQAEHREAKQAKHLSDEPASFDFTWWECALSLLRRMLEDGLVPDSQTYSSVVSALESAGQWQRAIGVLQSMPSISPLLGNSLSLEVISNTLDEPEVYEQPNLYCLNAAISACEKGGAWVEALQIYENIRAQAQMKGSTRPNFITVNSILIALEKAGQVELAMALYEEATRDKIVNPWKRRRDNDGSVQRMMDLHQFSAPMAAVAVKSYMNSLLGSRKEPNIKSDTVFIVGKGKGSRGEPVLMHTIMKVLKEEFGLEARVDKKNSGRIRLSKDLIESLIKEKSWKL